MGDSIIEKISNVGADWAIVVAVIIQWVILQQVSKIKDDIHAAIADLRLTLAKEYWTSAQIKEYIKERENVE